MKTNPLYTLSAGCHSFQRICPRCVRGYDPLERTERVSDCDTDLAIHRNRWSLLPLTSLASVVLRLDGEYKAFQFNQIVLPRGG